MEKDRKRHIQDSDETDIGSNSPKSQKLLSVISSKDRESARSPRQKNLASQSPDELIRSKRFFAGMMGHLNKAKEILNVDSAKIDTQSQIKTVVATKYTSRSGKIAELRRKKLELLNEEENLLSEKKKLESQHAQFVETTRLLGNFLYVECDSVGIHWLPLRPSSSTRAMLEERALEAEVRSAAHEREGQTRLESLEGRIGALKERVEALETELNSLVPPSPSQPSTVPPSHEESLSSPNGYIDTNENYHDEGEEGEREEGEKEEELGMEEREEKMEDEGEKGQPNQDEIGQAGEEKENEKEKMEVGDQEEKELEEETRGTNDTETDAEQNK